jgi:hypothetical protein
VVACSKLGFLWIKSPQNVLSCDEIATTNELSILEKYIATLSPRGVTNGDIQSCVESLKCFMEVMDNALKLAKDSLYYGDQT